MGDGMPRRDEVVLIGPVCAGKPTVGELGSTSADGVYGVRPVTTRELCRRPLLACEHAFYS